MKFQGISNLLNVNVSVNNLKSNYEWTRHWSGRAQIIEVAKLVACQAAISLDPILEGSPEVAVSRSLVAYPEEDILEEASLEEAFLELADHLVPMEDSPMATFPVEDILEVDSLEVRIQAASALATGRIQVAVAFVASQVGCGPQLLPHLHLKEATHCYWCMPLHVSPSASRTLPSS